MNWNDTIWCIWCRRQCSSCIIYMINVLEKSKCFSFQSIQSSSILQFLYPSAAGLGLRRKGKHQRTFNIQHWNLELSISYLGGSRIQSCPTEQIMNSTYVTCISNVLMFKNWKSLKLKPIAIATNLNQSSHHIHQHPQHHHQPQPQIHHYQ